MSIASNVQEVVTRPNIIACAIPYGYAVTNVNARVFFNRPLSYVRKGRCTMLRAEYEDGSILVFTYSDANGARYRVENN